MARAPEPSTCEPARPDRLTATVCRLIVLLATALTIARLTQADPLQSANDRSRWSTVRALVEQGTYRIDDVRRIPGWDTIDLVRHEGHFYSTKPPLLSTMVAELYRAGRTAFGWNMHDRLHETTRLILLVLNVLPMTLALLLFSRLIRRYARSPVTAVFVTACAAFATQMTPFVVTLNNHTPAAIAVMFALCAAVPIVAEGERQWWRFALAGFWSAFAFTNELPAAALMAALCGVLAWRAPLKTLLWFVPAAAPPVIAFFALNQQVTGEWMPFYSAYGSEKYEFVHEGVPSYWMNPRGLDKARDSFPVYLLHCTVGHHGVLSLSPIFLFTLAGWCVALRHLAQRIARERWRALGAADLNWIHAVGMVLTGVVFAFFLSRTENYNYGGVSVALRWLLWLTPFWLLAMLPVMGGRAASTDSQASLHVESTVDCEPCGRIRTTAGAAALAVSVFSAWYPWDGPWRQPWIFTLMENGGWIDYSDPRPQLDRPLKSWVSRLPEAPSKLNDYWIEFAGVDVDGTGVSLRLADGGPVGTERELRIVEVTRRRDGEADRVERHWIDVEAFDSGVEPAQFLVWPEGEPSPEIRTAAVEFWQGLPRAAAYAAAAERYLKLPVRVDAFHCLQANGQAVVRDETTGVATRFRRDAWLCEEVPYGVVQFETQVIDARRQVMARQMMTLTAFGAAEAATE